MSNENSQGPGGSFFGSLLSAFTPVADTPVGVVVAVILVPVIVALAIAGAFRKGR